MRHAMRHAIRHAMRHAMRQKLYNIISYEDSKLRLSR